MHSNEIRARFLAFFEKRGHAVMPSAPLVPANDPSVLFNTAGMQPLVPYLLGQTHPLGKRICDVQKCVRTGDLDDIGDNRHLSFFEMMGNWSLGDYFKKEAISWSYEFLTSKEEGLGLDPTRLYVTVFEGNADAAEDTEAQEIWKSLGISENRIYKLGVEDNWWSPGENGPCGPDTEMFYDMTGGTLGDLSKEDFLAAVSREDAIEIWNDVFMEYEKKDGKVVGKLASKNVDTGAGLERITAVMQGKKTAYDTDLFAPLFGKIDEFTGGSTNELAKRIVADHMRSSVFMIADGVLPANTARGYILRRLLRRAVRYADVLGMKPGSLFWLAGVVIEQYGTTYPELIEHKDTIQKEIDHEESKFRETLSRGIKEFEKGEDPFLLFTTYGFPFELTLELAKEAGRTIDVEDFNTKMKAHQDSSRTASAGMFKGGLANHSEKTVRLHTAHHLLLAALQEVLGKEVKQRGSNITEERLRIDFAFDRKMTDEEKKRVEDIVNAKIQAALPVTRKEMPRDEAEQLGAEREFGAKYADVVSVYFIGEATAGAFSKEFCGGPHVANTSELGHFKIQKEEASSQGVRRIKGILE
jgi:alanyl-tRNA synthetase